MISRKTTAQSRLDRRQKGFTLTEIAIVLGIIGLILGAIWVAAASVYNAQRLNHGTTATLQIAQGVRSLYATSSTTGYATPTDLTSILISASIIPTDLVSGTYTAGPFPGGSTNVTATGDGNGFVISMSKLTQAACINLLVAIGGNSRDPGLYMDGADTQALASGTVSDIGQTATAAAITTAVIPTTANTATYSAATGTGGCAAATTGLTAHFGFTLK